MSRAISFCLILLSAVLYILAFPKFNFSMAAWVALTPVAYFAAHSAPRQAFSGGWLAGTLAYCGVLYWIVVTFQAAHLSIALALNCLLLLSAYLGFFWGLWAWFLSKAAALPAASVRHLTKNPCLTPYAPTGEVRSVFLPFAGAAAWVATEYLRTYLFSGFPWALLGDSQCRNLTVAQIASFTSVYGVSFLAAMTGIAISTARWKPIVMSIGVMSAVCIFGHFQLQQSMTPPPALGIKVALLQGNIDQYKKWDKAYVEEIENTYEKLNQRAQQETPKLIIWPETSVPGYLLQDPPLRRWLENLVRSGQASHLIGTPVIHNEMSYNSAFSIDPEGRLEGEYSKHHLVPFGEIVPWASILGRWVHVLNDLGGFQAGRGSSVLSVGGLPVGVNICYEAIFPNLVRKSVRQGAQAIANMTNDGWYMRTAAPYQHLMPNIFRAIENDRWLLRADNTGVSAIIDPRGRLVAASPIFETAVLSGIVEARSTQTFYTRYGDVFAWFCCLFCALIYLRDILQR